MVFTVITLSAISKISHAKGLILTNGDPDGSSELSASVTLQCYMVSIDEDLSQVAAVNIKLKGNF